MIKLDEINELDNIKQSKPYEICNVKDLENITNKVEQVLNEHTLMKDAMQDYVNQIYDGGVNSVNTYSKFREILTQIKVNSI